MCVPRIKEINVSRPSCLAQLLAMLALYMRSAEGRVCALLASPALARITTAAGAAAESISSAISLCAEDRGIVLRRDSVTREAFRRARPSRVRFDARKYQVERNHLNARRKSSARRRGFGLRPYSRA